MPLIASTASGLICVITHDTGKRINLARIVAIDRLGEAVGQLVTSVVGGIASNITLRVRQEPLHYLYMSLAELKILTACGVAICR
jgi:hypothetical protein